MTRVLLAVVIVGCSTNGGAPTGGPGGKGGADDSARVTIAVADATARITVTPPPGYHINEKYPWKLALGPAAGTPRVERLDEEQLTLAVSLTGADAVRGQLDLGMCASDRCVTKSVPVVIAAR